VRSEEILFGWLNEEERSKVPRGKGGVIFGKSELPIMNGKRNGEREGKKTSCVGVCMY